MGRSTDTWNYAEGFRLLALFIWDASPLRQDRQGCAGAQSQVPGGAWFQSCSTWGGKEKGF